MKKELQEFVQKYSACSPVERITRTIVLAVKQDAGNITFLETLELHTITSIRIAKGEMPDIYRVRA